MSSKLLPFWLLLFFFHWACKYEPVEINYHIIKMPNNNIDITVLDTSAITVLRGDVTFAIQTVLSGHTVKSIEGYLNDQELALDTTHPGFISFRTDYYPDGNYILRLILYASTNSGSMADRMGAESFYVEKDYPVTVFNAPHPSPVNYGIYNRERGIIYQLGKVYSIRI